MAVYGEHSLDAQLLRNVNGIIFAFSGDLARFKEMSEPLLGRHRATMLCVGVHKSDHEVNKSRMLFPSCHHLR